MKTLDFIDDLENVADQDLWDIWESIQDGSSSPAETFGFDDASLNSIERMALGYYRAERYDIASVIYGFLLRMAPRRASAWRGLGACAQARKEYNLAAMCFRRAVEHSPDDLISKVFLGECLCQLGDTETGLALLDHVVKQRTKVAAEQPYKTRARAILAAKGGVPPKVVLKRAGAQLVDEVEAFYKGVNFNEPPLELDEDREIQWEDIKRNPELMGLLGDLKKAVAEGRLTLAEVGGFTENELDGAYAVACKYAEMGQLMQAVQIAGYLIFIDSYKARYYQLVGICMQRLEQYDAADQYYGMANAMEPKDAMTKVYRGEAKIMGGKVDDGLQWIRDGLAIAQQDSAAHKDLITRANVLLKQFSA